MLLMSQDIHTNTWYFQFNAYLYIWFNVIRNVHFYPTNGEYLWETDITCFFKWPTDFMITQQTLW